MSLSLCAALLFGLLAFSINASKNKQRLIARYIYNEYAMGEAYAEWQQVLNYVEFEDSKEYWDKVQKDWEAQGLQVSWEYVCQVHEEAIKEGVPFHTHFRESFSQDFCSKDDSAFIILAMMSIAFVVLAFKTAQNYKEIDYIENTDIKKATQQIATTRPEQDSITETDEIDTMQDDNKNFHIENGKLIRYTGHAESVTIPDGVKTVGSHAFSKNERIKTVFIPSTVKSIGRGAFEECKNLEKVTMSNGISKIGKYAFRFCCELSSVMLPNGIRTIENGAFEGCSELCGITLPDGLINIGESAFHCCGLREIDIPGSVKSIEALTFCNCELLDITLHEGLEIIHEHAFGGCEAIITIPNSVQHIDWRAFEDLLDNSHVETIYYAGSEERAKEIGLLDLVGDVDVYYDGKSDED